MRGSNAIGWAWLGLGAWLFTAGCDGSHGPTNWTSEQLWSSAHFRYHARPDDVSVGPAVLDVLEEHGTLVAGGWFGLDAGAWGPIDYFKYRSLSDFQGAGTPCGQRPCALLFGSGRIEIHTPTIVDEHEIVHGYVLRFACAPPLFREGLAASVSCDPAPEPALGASTAPPSWLSGSWRDAAALPEGSPAVYGPAGLLTSWIIDRWGVERFIAFYRVVGCGGSLEDVAAAFAAQYGVSLDSVWDDMVAAPTKRLCTFATGCAEPPATGTVRLTTALDGYRLAVPIPGDGALIGPTYTASAPVPVVRPCTSAAALPGFDDHWPAYSAAWFPTAVLPGGAENVVALPNVRGTDDDQEVELDLAISALPATTAVGAPGSCSDVTPLVLGATSGSVLVWPVPAGPIVLAVQSSQAGPGQTARIRDDGNGAATVDACEACADGILQNCASAESGPTFAAPWLRVTWSPAVYQPLTLSFDWE